MAIQIGTTELVTQISRKGTITEEYKKTYRFSDYIKSAFVIATNFIALSKNSSQLKQSKDLLEGKSIRVHIGFRGVSVIGAADIRKLSCIDDFTYIIKQREKIEKSSNICEIAKAILKIKSVKAYRQSDYFMSKICFNAVAFNVPVIKKFKYDTGNEEWSTTNIIVNALISKDGINKSLGVDI